MSTLDTCFVIMPISTPESYAEKYNDPEHFKHVLAHLFIPALKLAKYEAIPPTGTGSDVIQAEIIRNLETSDMVLCDISTLNPNVFFELGIRTSLDKPVVLVQDNLTMKTPFDTGPINTYTYDASLLLWTSDSEIRALSAHITEAAQRSDNRNSLWRYFGLTQRARPAEIANPTEAKLDLLLAEVTRLSASAISPPSKSSLPPTPFILGGRGDGRRVIHSAGISRRVALEVIKRIDQNLIAETPPRQYQDFVQALSHVDPWVKLAFVGYDSREDVVILNAGSLRLSLEYAREVAQVAEDFSFNYIIISTRESENQQTEAQQ